MPSRTETLNESIHRPEIDGLRAFAVVPVVVFHLGFDWLPGGFMGVDVFFVISGFLINRILLRDIGAGEFSFSAFMIRRILRILPAMLMMIAATLVVTWLCTFRPAQPAISAQSVAALLSVANVYFWWTEGNYWAPAVQQSPLLHTWSLSVEEQFYLVAPLCLWAVHKVAPQRLRESILVGTIAGIGLFIFGLVTGRVHENFYLLPGRAWELLAGGCLAAFVPEGCRQRNLASRWRGAAGLFGLALIVATYVLAPSDGLRPNWMVSLAVAGTGLVLAFAESGPAHWLLTMQPLTWLGRISYSLYLWHWPVIVIAELLGWALNKAVLCIPALVLATLSYYFVEQPCRRNHRLLPMVAAGYALALGLAVVMSCLDPHYPTAGFDKPPLTMPYYCLSGPRRFRFASHEQFWNTISAGYSVIDRVRPADEYLQGGLILGPEGTPRVVVLGDSHACAWGTAIHAVTERKGITVSFQTAAGDQPFIDLPEQRRSPSAAFDRRQKTAFDEARMDWIARWKPELVIVGFRWSACLESDVHPLLTALEAHCKRIVLVEQPPELALASCRAAMQWLCYQGVQPETGVRHYLPTRATVDYQRGRAVLTALARRYRAVTVMPTYDLYIDKNDERQALVLDGKKMLYLDDNHLTDHGARMAQHRFEAIIGEFVTATPIAR